MEIKDFVADELTQKLILLFIFEKMEFALTDASISEIIVANPSWMTYMDFKDALFQLGESKYIFRSNAGSEINFHLSQDGRNALSHFFHKIPASIREEITEYANTSRQKFKRNQEYMYDYFKNKDGTHTVVLKIKDHYDVDNLLEIRMKTSTRAEAQRAAAKWKDKAALMYESIKHTMVDEEDKEEA